MTTRRQRGWSGSGAVSDFMPAPIEEDYDDGTRDPLPEIDLDLIRKAANYAAARSRSPGWMPDKRDLAWEGIVLEWLENPEASFFDLVDAGHRAITNDLVDHHTMHGTRRQSFASGESTGYTGRRFAVYWNQSSTTFQPDVITPMAVRQVWAALSDEDRDILLSVTLAESMTKAAEAFGLPQSTYSRNLRRARERAAQVLFDWERAPELQHLQGKRVTHCRRGHSYDEHAQWTIDSRGHRSRRCGECNRLAVAAARAKKRTAA